MSMISQEDEDSILQNLPEEDRAKALVEGTPTPDATALPANSGDLLRNYLTGKGGIGGPDPRLVKAQAQSNNNLLATRLAQAGANLGGSIARAHPVDQKPFDQLAESANAPMENAQKQIAMENTKGKLLQDYFAKDTANKLSEDRIGAYKGRTDTLAQNAKSRLALAEKGFGLREGSQAAKASEKFLSDPVMKTTSQQQQQLDKALGRIADIKSGKTKFTTSMKADLEKDLANVISGGQSSSLGQLGKIEFDSYKSDWQRAMDKINGFQGDINSPEYLTQLEQTFNGLQNDIQRIQSKRAKTIGDTMGTAYSGNALATKAIQENVGRHANNGSEAPQASANPKLKAAQDWLSKNPNDPQADAVRKKIAEMGA